MSKQNSDAPGSSILSPALAEIQEVACLRAERDHLTARHRAAQTDAQAAEVRVQAASSQLTREQRDVAELEKLSLTRVLASIRGRRLDDLEREQNEVRAAQYAYAVEHARWQDLVREETELLRRLNTLGLLDQRWEGALTARAAEFGADTAPGIRLAELGAQVGRIEADRREIDEALAAAVHAGGALQAAGKKLSSAGDWATYDTFFGGGMFADLIKHQHLDEASKLIKAADQALHHLGTELADVGITAVGGLGITEMSRTLDVWFDNIFSDWSIAEKIKDARQRVDATLRALAGLDHELRTRLAGLHAEERQANVERENLLRA